MALLDGRTAVITGGAQGIGFAIAERFVAEGARVVLGDLDLDATADAAKRLGGAGSAAAVRCDVTSAERRERADRPGDGGVRLARRHSSTTPGSPATRPCGR